MGTFGDTSDIISSTVDKIITTVNETQDAFIFSTLSSYAAEQLKNEIDVAVKKYIAHCYYAGRDIKSDEEVLHHE